MHPHTAIRRKHSFNEAGAKAPDILQPCLLLISSLGWLQ